MDLSYLGQLALSFLPGIKYTLGLFAITLVISLPLGLGLAFLRSGKNVVLKNLTALYVWLLRGTPLLLQLFFVYFGLCFIPGIGKYLTFDRFPAACIAFVLNYAAYFCEIFRGGLLSVNKGQYEAARVLGFSPRLTNTKIVIPQMLRVCLPPVTNECINLVKDTALVTAIGVTEVLYFAKTAANRDVSATAYFVAAIFYLIFTGVLTKLFKYFERKYSY